MYQLITENLFPFGIVCGMFIYAIVSSIVIETMQYVDYLYERREKRKEEKKYHGS